MARLELQGVGKSFGAGTVLQALDLVVPSGEMLVIVGASGCGKSTLLRLVAGLETPSSGRVLIDGRDVTRVDPSARDIAMVFQNYALYPHMSVAANMEYALKLRGMARAERAAKVAEVAALLGLSALLERKPRQLSGGQRQRVAMGRAIVRDPKLFLFDEPLSNLDAKLRVSMRAEIRKLQKSLGVTSLYVTHDQVEAMTLGDRLLVLNQGRVAQLGAPMEVFARPANTYVAGFIGAPAMNFLDATVAEDAAAVLAGGWRVALPAGLAVQPGTEITLGIRPEHVTLTDDGAPLEIDLAEPLGSETLLHGHIADGTAMTVKVAGGPVGERARIALPAEQVHIFDRASGVRI